MCSEFVLDRNDANGESVSESWMRVQLTSHTQHMCDANTHTDTNNYMSVQ